MASQEQGMLAPASVVLTWAEEAARWSRSAKGLAKGEPGFQHLSIAASALGPGRGRVVVQELPCSAIPWGHHAERMLCPCAASPDAWGFFASSSEDVDEEDEFLLGSAAVFLAAWLLLKLLWLLRVREPRAQSRADFAGLRCLPTLAANSWGEGEPLCRKPAYLDSLPCILPITTHRFDPFMSSSADPLPLHVPHVQPVYVPVVSLLAHALLALASAPVKAAAKAFDLISIGKAGQTKKPHKASLGDPSKFTYCSKTKRWLLNGEPVAEDAPLRPPPMEFPGLPAIHVPSPASTMEAAPATPEASASAAGAGGDATATTPGATSTAATTPVQQQLGQQQVSQGAGSGASAGAAARRSWSRGRSLRDRYVDVYPHPPGPVSPVNTVNTSAMSHSSAGSSLLPTPTSAGGAAAAAGAGATAGLTAAGLPPRFFTPTPSPTSGHQPYSIFSSLGGAAAPAAGTPTGGAAAQEGVASSVVSPFRVHGFSAADDHHHYNYYQQQPHHHHGAEAQGSLLPSRNSWSAEPSSAVSPTTTTTADDGFWLAPPPAGPGAIHSAPASGAFPPLLTQLNFPGPYNHPLPQHGSVQQKGASPLALAAALSLAKSGSGQPLGDLPGKDGRHEPTESVLGLLLSASLACCLPAYLGDLGLPALLMHMAEYAWMTLPGARHVKSVNCVLHSALDRPQTCPPPRTAPCGATWRRAAMLLAAAAWGMAKVMAEVPRPTNSPSSLKACP